MIDEKILMELLEEIANEHPYKVPGNDATYSDYNQGWTDCINWVISMAENLPQVGEWILEHEKEGTGDNLRKDEDFLLELPVSALFRQKMKEDAEKARKWTPAAQPPKKHGKYLVTEEGRENAVIRLYEGTWDTLGTVLAWMPLPEPYKG